MRRKSNVVQRQNTLSSGRTIQNMMSLGKHLPTWVMRSRQSRTLKNILKKTRVGEDAEILVEESVIKCINTPLILPLFSIIINMPKSPLPDKLLIKIDTARRVHKSGRP